jgi:hypothetical protein
VRREVPADREIDPGREIRVPAVEDRLGDLPEVPGERGRVAVEILPDDGAERTDPAAQKQDRQEPAGGEVDGRDRE